jgi:hypothetical protein
VPPPAQEVPSATGVVEQTPEAVQTAVLHAGAAGQLAHVLPPAPQLEVDWLDCTTHALPLTQPRQHEPPSHLPAALPSVQALPSEAVCTH